MEAIKSFFKDLYLQDPGMMGVVLVEPQKVFYSALEGFDLLFLVFHRELKANSISHYIKERYRIQERRIRLDGEKPDMWSIIQDRNMVQWTMWGEILLQRGTFVEDLKRELAQFRPELRKQKMFSEFCLFLNSYLEARILLRAGHQLDAFSSILSALHHWARVVIIDAGHHPETMLWKQVRSINPGVYKLYEELTQSLESVEKRVELLLLALDFSAMSKMESCCELLLEILKSRETPWSISELNEHPDLAVLGVNTAPVLRKLAKKSLIREVLEIREPAMVTELKYTADN